MALIERSIQVEVPASVAYNTWTQFELFPHFMDGVESVEQRGDRHLHWRATIFGKREEWDAEITEQIPDKRVAWRSERGAVNAGVVTFHRISDESSRVMLQLEYEPADIAEKLGDALGLVQHRVDGDLKNFKKFIEEQAIKISGWRGEIPAKRDAGQPPASRSASSPAK